MIVKIAKYKVKKEKLKEVVAAIQIFVDIVQQDEEGTLRYEAYQEPDETRFIHFMMFKDEAAEKFHKETEYVKEFADILYPLCDEEPEFTKLEVV